VKTDHSIELKKEDGTIQYNNSSYPDLGQLSQKFPQHQSHALALQIRYKYLCLTTHGLALPYEKMGYSRSEHGAVEAFASAFNHFFDQFCSAFPDLEQVFGSLGSFFQQDLAAVKHLFVNSPFDEVLIEKSVAKIESWLSKSSDGVQCTIVVPQWNNFTALENLKQSRFKHENEKVYSKGQLMFTDYMQPQPKEISPCNIVKFVLMKKQQEQEEFNEPLTKKMKISDQ
jgi:hypothetical protein